MAAGTPRVASGLVIAYEPHAKQAELHANASEARFRVAVAGRQSGKTLAGIAEIAQWGMEAPNRQLWWTTASYRTKDKAWRDLTAHLPREIVRKRHESELYAELGNGSRISIHSADAPDSLVSESVHGAVCDEFAQWRPTVWPQFLRSTLAVTNGPALFIGTPRGRNWAHDLYQLGLRGEEGWAAFHWRSDESPYFSREEFERLQRELPERIFRQEILAEFVEGGGEVFRGIDACISPLAKPDGYTVLGVDLARTRDWTAIHALNARRETVLRDRWQRLTWDVTKLRIIATYQRLGCAKAVIDATGVGDPITEDLMRAGLHVEPVVFTNASKANLVTGLVLLFEQAAIRIPDDADLREELKSFTFEVLPSGRDRYAAPAGKTDDTVAALALAAWGLRHIRFDRGFKPPPLTPEERELEEYREFRAQVVREANDRALGVGHDDPTYW